MQPVKVEDNSRSLLGNGTGSMWTPRANLLGSSVQICYWRHPLAPPDGGDSYLRELWISIILAIDAFISGTSSRAQEAPSIQSPSGAIVTLRYCLLVSSGVESYH